MNEYTAFILTVSILSISAFFGGRYFGHAEAGRDIKAMLDNTWDTEYVIPQDDPHFAGEFASGRCFHGDYEQNLIKYVK